MRYFLEQLKKFNSQMLYEFRVSVITWLNNNSQDQFPSVKKCYEKLKQKQENIGPSML